MVIKTITERGILSKNNNVSLVEGTNNIGFNIAIGTTVSATINTITIETMQALTGKVIEIIYGNGVYQTREIIDVFGAQLTVSPDWNVIPDTSSKYVVHQHSARFPDQLPPVSGCYVKLASSASSVDAFYSGAFIKIIDTNGRGEILEVTEYEGATKIACLEPEPRTKINTNFMYVIFGESGTVASATSTTVTLDGNQSDIIATKHYIELIDGTGQGQVRMISGIVGDVVTVATWTTTPDTSTRYTLYGGWSPAIYENVLRHAIITVATDINIHEGERCIIDMESAMDISGINEIRSITELSRQMPTKTHSLTIITEFFRLKVVSMGPGLNGQIQTIINSYKSGKLTAQIEDTITSNSDCELSRAVLTGKTINSKYQNINADSAGNLSISIKKPLDGFGSVVTTQHNQFIEVMFLNNFINPFLVKKDINGSGTVTVGSNICNISSGVDATCYVQIQSQRRLKYCPGLSVIARFTAVFGTPIANSTQIIGIGSNCNGVFVGYDGINFGILLRRGGKQEIRTLTVTAAAVSNGNITITLNGDTKDIAILAADTISGIVRKIMLTDFSNVGEGWDLTDEGSKIFFISKTAGAKSGTCSLTSAISAAGTFATIITGSATTDNWIYQRNWNIDRAFGGDDTPALNFLRGNVFEISFQWLGFGNITVRAENPITGTFHDLHIIQYSNTAILTSVENPNLPLYAAVSKSGASSDSITLKTASMGMFIMGNYNKILGTRNSVSGIYTVGTSPTLVGGTYYNLLAMQNSPVFNGQKNCNEVLLYSFALNISSSSIVTQGGMFTFYALPVFSPATLMTWSDRDSVNSVIKYSTTLNTILGGIEIFSMPCGPNQHIIQTILDLDVYIRPGYTFCIAFKPIADIVATGLSLASDIGFSISWIQR